MTPRGIHTRTYRDFVVGTNSIAYLRYQTPGLLALAGLLSSALELKCIVDDGEPRGVRKTEKII